ncbi:hypothetical protein WICPIJ_009617 [Wickerhamomyces pijperi]|uniref:Uncharacterized protein n=1 Tax=Wickerhamomyces pijperi TaxID=599730 RepID=A0A9P8PMS6_WICPI|nr:hypothetical protein WICPIJ_009617 [Wickerhamomyces pijperi]
MMSEILVLRIGLKKLVIPVDIRCMVVAAVVVEDHSGSDGIDAVMDEVGCLVVFAVVGIAQVPVAVVEMVGNDVAVASPVVVDELVEDLREDLRQNLDQTLDQICSQVVDRFFGIECLDLKEEEHLVTTDVFGMNLDPVKNLEELVLLVGHFFGIEKVQLVDHLEEHFFEIEKDHLDLLVGRFC